MYDLTDFKAISMWIDKADQWISWSDGLREKQVILWGVIIHLLVQCFSEERMINDDFQ